MKGGTQRAAIKSGQRVRIVLKEDRRSGKLTEVVRDILTNSPTHPHGIKVLLVAGEVGRVKELCDPDRTVRSLLKSGL